MLTSKQFQSAARLSDELAAKWFPHVLAAMSKYQINTPLRQAHFLAQVGHESTGFTRTEENLNYRYGALLAMFGKRISKEDALKYGRVDGGPNAHPADQKMISNIIYANRNGNGSVESGDGYRYRGRGLIQVTGKANYAALVDQLGVDIVAEPHLLVTPHMAAESAAAWWFNHKLNALADADDVDRITRVINGGTNGLDDRKTRLTQAKGILWQT
ncbi:hypothetical protein CIG19_18885 [Enterobacterales bacterium CwR94]|nr:hypothetical protein CIG19_18885 [Enterobacterales bacterium CwR94]